MIEPAAQALPAMSRSFREEEVDLSLLPVDCRDIESQAFVDAVFALHQQPYEGMEGRFSCSYTEGLFEFSWTPLGDTGTELMQVCELLEDGRQEVAIPLLEQLLEREPDNLEALHVLTMKLSGHRLLS